MRVNQLLLVLVALGLVGCSDYKSTGGNDDLSRQRLNLRSEEAVKNFRATDPSMKHFFDSAYGYAVFPVVGKGAVGIGGAHGDGQVYQGGQHVGYATLTQATIGFQLGGQTYSEIIFFKDKPTFDNFTQGNLEFSGQASAVAAASGASADADFEHGVAVFTLPRGGLMFEASIGGQKFRYWPK